MILKIGSRSLTAASRKTIIVLKTSVLKKIYLLLLPLAYSLTIVAQETSYSPERLFSTQQLLSDFDLLVQSLEEVHPSLYDFISADSLAKVIVETKAGLKKPMTEAAFHLGLRRFIRHIGCGHTTARPSASWYTYQSKSSQLLPIEVYLWQDRLFIRKAYDQEEKLAPGLEIRSIDGREASAIIAEMRAIQEMDGTAPGREDRTIERLFKTYYLFLYGEQADYLLSVRETHKPPFTVKVKAGGITAGKNQPEAIAPILEMDRAQFYIPDDTPELAVLDIDGFSGKRFKKFFKAVFTQVEADQIEHLVIDLRGNRGGYIPTGNKLLSYLLPEDFEMAFRRLPEKPKRNKHLSMPFSSRMTSALFNLMPDKNKDDPYRNYAIRHRVAKQHGYTGKLYVLVDGHTFSMGSYVATKLKYGAECTVLGEETAGGAYGSNAILKYELTLPNTEIRVILPNYFLDHQVDVDVIGHGLQPDVPIHYELTERLRGQDKALEQIKAWIQK